MDLTVNQTVPEQTYSFKTAGTYVEDDINLTVEMAAIDMGENEGIKIENEVIYIGGNTYTRPIGSVITLGSQCYSEGTGTETTCSSYSEYDTLKDPSQFGYSGTWALIDKSFGSGAFTDALSINDAAEVSSISANYVTRVEKSITIHGSFVNKEAHSDTQRNLLKLNLSKIGVKALSGASSWFTGIDDGGNGIVQMALNNTTGIISEIDFIPRGNSTSIPTTKNLTTSFTITVNIPHWHMYDSACSMFHWKRIA